MSDTDRVRADGYNWRRDCYLAWLWWCAWCAADGQPAEAERLWRRWQETHG
jgi:hypothetical protein